MFAKSSKAFIFQKFSVKFYFELSLHIFQHGSSLSLMSATPGACINLPRYEARRRHLIMICGIFGNGQTNTLTLCYLLGKTYKGQTIRKVMGGWGIFEPQEFFFIIKFLV